MAYFDRYGVEHPGKRPRVDHSYRVLHWDVHDENGKRNGYSVIKTVFNKAEAVKLAKSFVASHPGADVEVYDTTTRQSIYGKENPRMAKYRVTVEVSARNAREAREKIQRMNRSRNPDKLAGDPNAGPGAYYGGRVYRRSTIEIAGWPIDISNIDGEFPEWLGIGFPDAEEQLEGDEPMAYHGWPEEHLTLEEVKKRAHGYGGWVVLHWDGEHFVNVADSGKIDKRMTEAQLEAARKYYHR